MNPWGLCAAALVVGFLAGRIWQQKAAVNKAWKAQERRALSRRIFNNKPRFDDGLYNIGTVEDVKKEL
jgi:hypothetical protein